MYFFIKIINTKFSLNWNRRAYTSQVYFEQYTENAGFKFKIFEPSFKDLGKRILISKNLYERI